MSTFIHGCASVGCIDTASEVVDIEGLDITSLARTGTITWEHNMGKDATGKPIAINLPAQVCGKIIEAKKIFNENDCSTESESYFWHKTKLPFVYIIAELLDEYTPSAKEAAGMFKYSKDHPEQQAILGFSVEGSELPKSRKGLVITRSIARKVTLTCAPANKMCVAEIYDKDRKSKIKNDFDDIFKSEANAIKMLKSEDGLKVYEEYLAKKEQDFFKSEEPKGIPRGWVPSTNQHSKLGTVVSMAHPEHGTVSVHKNPENSQYEVKHAGKLAGIKGVKGSFGTNAEAISHAQKFVHGLHNGSILARSPTNINSNPKLQKSLEAGSGNAAPSTLVNGAAYQTENLSKPKKTDWNKRAKEEYERWPQKDKFESFMAKRMPHLHAGEIKAIGRTLALQKSIDLEKSLAKLIKK